jgi:hypothetical protein
MKGSKKREYTAERNRGRKMGKIRNRRNRNK